VPLVVDAEAGELVEGGDGGEVGEDVMHPEAQGLELGEVGQVFEMSDAFMLA
jgi:hypothetical protein